MSPDPHPRSIAVVDDDASFAGYLQTFLALRGYQSRVYTRGDEFVAAARSGESPDVVLLDVAMPGLDGLQTLKALKAAHPQMQIIMLSGGGQASIIVEAVRLGAADYVVKPGDPGGLGEIALDAAIKRASESTQMVSEVTALREQLSDARRQPFIGWGESPAMRHVAAIIDRVADSDVTVLIRGESGVGKELVARAIHQHSIRSSRPFVKVNCAALPGELLETELFGHEKGAFTDAATTRIGKFEQADTGTIFLDEIGEMPPALQAKILHVLQDAEFTKLGSNKSIKIDVRVVTATNRDLEGMVVRGRFREDLYYRLKVIEAVVPPLRARRDEILPLADSFIAKYSARYNRPGRSITEDLRQHLLAYDWPGNVRELENMVKRFVILQDEQLLLRELTRRSVPVTETPTPQVTVRDEEEEDDDEADVVDATGTGALSGRSLFEISREASLAAERSLIEQTLQDVQWNRRRAAERLGVSYKTLLNKIKETGLERA